VKRTGRDESTWVVIHKCTEATLRISLYSYLYPKLEKLISLSNYLLRMPFNRIGKEKCGTGSSCQRIAGGGVVGK
jgi:hypothetical protein